MDDASRHRSMIRTPRAFSTFDNLSLAVRLARLDELGAGGVQLEAMRLVSILHLSHLNVLQRDDAEWLLVGRVLEVVETVVVQYEPPSLPALVTSA